MNEPINWTVVAQVLVPIVTGVLGVWGYHISKKAQKGDRENKIIDQLQETLEERDKFWKGQLDAVRDTAERAEAKAASADNRASRVETENRLITEYAYQLRRHIDTEQGPPAPPWPNELDAIRKGP